MPQATPVLGDPTRGTITKRDPMAYFREITFREASDHVLPFGRYVDQTIDHIAKTDPGLLYLQWLYDERRDKIEGTNRIPSANERETNGCLHVYLNDPTIAKEVVEAKGRDGGKGRG